MPPCLQDNRARWDNREDDITGGAADILVTMTSPRGNTLCLGSGQQFVKDLGNQCELRVLRTITEYYLKGTITERMDVSMQIDLMMSPGNLQKLRTFVLPNSRSLCSLRT
jgi:hypothetical protein